MAEFDQHTSDYKQKLASSLGIVDVARIDQFARHKIKKIAKAQDWHAPGHFLDFGCGVGLTLPHLAALLPELTPVMADQSLESLEQLSSLSHVNFKLLHIERTIPLEDHCMDVALASCVFHHIEPQTRAHWLTELRRVLRPGCSLFIAEHNPFNPLTRFIVSRSPLDANAHLVSARSMCRLCTQVGFKKVAVNYMVYAPPAWCINQPLEKILRRLPLGAQYMVQVRA